MNKELSQYWDIYSSIDYGQYCVFTIINREDGEIKIVKIIKNFPTSTLE